MSCDPALHFISAASAQLLSPGHSGSLLAHPKAFVETPDLCHQAAPQSLLVRIITGCHCCTPKVKLQFNNC